MFGFLKDKLKGALGKLTKEVEKEAIVEKKEVLVEEIPKAEKKESQKDIKKETKSKEEKISETKKEETPKDIKSEEITQTIKVPEKKGFLKRIFGRKDEEEVIEKKEELLNRAEKVEIVEEPIRPIEKRTEQKTEQKKKIVSEKKKNNDVILKAEQPKLDQNDTIKNNTIEKSTVEKRTIDISELDVKSTAPIHKQSEEEQDDITKEIEIKSVEKKEEKIELAEQKTEILPKQPIKPHYQEVEERREQKPEHKEEAPKGFFTKITETFTKVQITEEKFEELFWDLEVVLLENNVAVEVIDKIKRDLKKELMTGKVSRKGVEDMILSTLRNSIVELFEVENIDLIEKIRSKNKDGLPYIITIIGVNGAGKTTSIAKLTHKFQKSNLSVVLAASDTFRAAAIQQLEEHANRLNVKMIKQEYNSDPAAVAFDAIKYAQAKKIDVVIIDTAGRLHSNTNLMRELEKVIRVCKPDMKIFVGESITGNDCVEQAKEFDKVVGIDAIILAKADVDDKGGAAISVSYILQRPILYLGTGQTYDDLKDFDSKMIIESLGL